MVAVAVSSILRSACSTLALRSPLGPFFFGGCRYAHRMDAFLHGVHGSDPSHFTFLFLQQSQARFEALDAAAVLISASLEGAAVRVADSCCASIAIISPENDRAAAAGLTVWNSS